MEQTLTLDGQSPPDDSPDDAHADAPAGTRQHQRPVGRSVRRLRAAECGAAVVTRRRGSIPAAAGVERRRATRGRPERRGIDDVAPRPPRPPRTRRPCCGATTAGSSSAWSTRPTSSPSTTCAPSCASRSPGSRSPTSTSPSCSTSATSSTRRCCRSPRSWSRTSSPTSRTSPACAAVVEEAPIVKFVNLVILQAVQERASDIHVEPTEHDLRIRFRIDGVLHERMRQPRSIIAGRHLPAEGHGRHRHRRAPRAPGRSHQPHRRGQGDRPARVDAADGVRREDRDADPRPRQRRAAARGPRLPARASSRCTEPRTASRTAPSSSPARPARASRPRSTPRSTCSTTPTRNIVTVEDPVEYRLAEHQPGPDEPEGRAHVRHRPAVDPAPGPRRRARRRDPRPRDRRHRHRGRADRPPRAVDAAHERRAVDAAAPDRDGHRAVPRHVGARLRARPAARPPAVRAVQGAVRADRGGARRRAAGTCRRRAAGRDALPRRRLPAVRRHRVPRPDRHPRGHAADRGDRPADRRPRQLGRHPPGRRSTRGWCRCARTAWTRSHEEARRSRRSHVSSPESNGSATPSPGIEADRCRATDSPTRAGARRAARRRSRGRLGAAAPRRRRDAHRARLRQRAVRVRRRRDSRWRRRRTSSRSSPTRTALADALALAYPGPPPPPPAPPSPTTAAHTRSPAGTSSNGTPAPPSSRPAAGRGGPHRRAARPPARVRGIRPPPLGRRLPEHPRPRLVATDRRATTSSTATRSNGSCSPSSTTSARPRSRRELELDVAYAMPGRSRFRMNVFRQRGSVGAVLRAIPFRHPRLRHPRTAADRARPSPNCRAASCS